jgi:PST family polysaccharide transporter
LKTINSNFKYLTILHFISLVAPLLLYPILTLRVGLEEFGNVIYLQAVVSYFGVICALGFNVSITKSIAENVDDINCIRKIFWNVIYVRVFLNILMFFPYLEIVDLIDGNALLASVIYLTVLSESLFPQWYYQGIQEMKSITIINSICKIFVLFLTLIFVQNAQDLVVYTIILIFVPITLYMTNLVFLINFKKISLSRPNYTVMKMLILNGLPLFYGTLSSIVKDRTNLILIGMFVGKSEVVIYDFIMKVISVCSMVYLNLTNAQFPELAKNKSKKLFSKYFKYITLVSICNFFLGTVFIWIFNDFLLEIVFNSDDFKSEFFWLSFILLSLIPLRAISYQIGLGVLVSNGYEKDYAFNLILSTVVYILFSTIVYCLDEISVYTISMCLVITVICEVIHRLYICGKRGVLHWVF